MNQERERLLKLLETGKIDQKDFRLLNDALSAKSSSRKHWLDWLLNPFDRVGGGKALLFGVVAMLVMNLIAPFARVHYPGVLDLQLANSATARPWLMQFGVLCAQQIADALITALAFFAAALVLRRPGLRFIDFLGMTALARAAYLPATLLFVALSLLDPAGYGTIGSHGLTSALIALIAIPSVVWFFVTHWHVYREASGLSGRALWFSYFIAILIAEAIAAPLVRLI